MVIGPSVIIIIAALCQPIRLILKMREMTSDLSSGIAILCIIHYWTIWLLYSIKFCEMAIIQYSILHNMAVNTQFGHYTVLDTVQWPYKSWKSYLHPVRHHLADLGKCLGGNIIKFKQADYVCLMGGSITECFLQTGSLPSAHFITWIEAKYKPLQTPHWKQQQQQQQQLNIMLEW